MLSMKRVASTVADTTTDVGSEHSAKSQLEKPKASLNSGLMTNLMLLRNPTLYSQYHAFQETQVNYYSLFLLLLYSTVTIYLSSMTYEEYPSPLALTNLFVSVILVVTVGILSCTLRCACLYPSMKSKISCHSIAFVDSAWLLALSIHASIELILTVMDGNCTRGRHYGCVNSGHLDGDRMVTAMTSPILFFLIIRSAKWEIVLVSYLVNIFTVLACIVISGYGVGSFLFLLPFTALALYEYQRQILSLFELHTKQQKIQEENDRLAEEAHSTELRHMIGNVAHDLKTPLSAFVCGVELIKSLAEEIKNSVMETEVMKRDVVLESINSILENAVNVINTNSFMLMTINRCIDYTKASKNMKLTPRLESFNLQEAINLPMHCMKDLQSDKVHIGSIPLAKHIAQFIITDKQWLQENILCLLSNAVKYSSRGMVMLSVSLVSHEATIPEGEVPNGLTETSKQVLRFEVEDTGIGLTDEVMANLFKPFKQAQRLAGGTGLGLFSLAKRMEALGGWYGVQKRRDGQQGTIFWFEIPYRPDEEAAVSFSKSRSLDEVLMVAKKRSPSLKTEVVHYNNSSPYMSARKVLNLPSLSHVHTHTHHIQSKKEVTYREGALNILIVDDSPSILKMSSKMLEKQGYNITTAEDGAQALDKVLENKSGGTRRFDCVLMDLQMPVMDGLESTNRIRKFENSCGEGGRLMIIGVSANSDTETMNDAYKAGVDAFIPKPFNFKLFNEVYHGMLEKNKSL